MSKVLFSFVFFSVFTLSTFAQAETAKKWVFVEPPCTKAAADDDFYVKKMLLQKEGIRVYSSTRYILSEPSAKCNSDRSGVSCYEILADQIGRAQGMGFQLASEQCKAPASRKGH